MRSLIVALISITLARSGAAQAPLDIRALGAPSFESYSGRDGLPDGVILSMGVDGQGVAWAASPHGIHRFLGHRWQLQVGREHGTVFHRMLLDHTGTLWAATQDKEVSIRDANGWRFLSRSNGVPPETYRAAEIYDSTGRPQTWLLTNTSGIYIRRGDQWAPDAGNASLPHPGFLTSAATTRTLYGEPRQWVGSGEAGVWYRREGESTWRQFQLPGLGPGQIEDIKSTVDEHGESLWISAFGQGVYRVDQRGVRRWSATTGELPANEVYSLAIEKSAAPGVTVWVASRRGLVRIHDEVADIFDRRHGLPSDQVRDVWLWRSPEGEDVLWLATESGVARAVFTEQRWQTASLMGSGGVGVFGVRVENGPRGERLWVASYRDGLGLYENGTWRRFTTANGDLPANDLRMIKRAPDLRGDSALWAGLEPGYLVRITEGPRFERIATPWPRGTGQAVLDILGRVQNGVRELWIATRKTGIYRWRADGWTSYIADEVQGEWRVFSLAEQVDRTGRSWLWAGTNQGLARFDGQRWQLLRNVPGLDARSFYGISFPSSMGSKQVLWIGTSLAGLIRLDVTNPQAPVVLPADGMPTSIDVTVYGATGDSRGRIYVCTNVGVQQLTPDATGWSSKLFGRQQGMVHEECNLNAQFVDRHDRFWTGTLSGLTVFDPGSTKRGNPKPLDIAEVRVNGQPVHPDSVRLTPDRRELRVEYSLRSWQRESETRYRTELLGYDPGPGSWSTEPSRVLASLPPGSYRLRIDARDYAGVEAQPAYLSFVVLPAWWQRRATQGFFAIAAVMLLVLGALWYTRRLREQKQQLETIVATRTEQLNVANEKLIELSYTDALTGLANRRRFQKQLSDMLAGAASPAPSSLAFIDVDHFKDINDRLGHPAGDEVLRSIAESLKASVPASALVARYGGEEFACLLPQVALHEAVDIGERMRAAVERTPVAVPGADEPVKVTISVGIAAVELASETDMHELLRVADIALYRAKGDGRNLVRSA